MANIKISQLTQYDGSDYSKVDVAGVDRQEGVNVKVNLAPLDEVKDKADTNGEYRTMVAGGAHVLIPGEGATSYDEQLGGRQVNNAPEMMGTRDASSTNSTSNISVREMRGGVFGGNQMVPENGGNVTLTANHKYLSVVNGVQSIFTASSAETRTFAEGDMLFDLTIGFPTDTTFVTSIGENDAIKVAHKLSFFAYDRTAANVVTHDDNATLSKMAEVVAKLGYQPTPQLWFGSAGRINLVDGNTGRIKQTIDMISQKTKAWNKALAILRERGIAIPSFLEKPCEFGVNDNICVKWDKDHLEVSCWVVDLGSLSYSNNSLDNNPCFYSSFKSKESGAGVILGYKVNDYPTEGESKWFSLLRGSSKAVWISKDDYADASVFKTAMQGQYLIYHLAEPLFIPYDEVLNLNLVDAKPYDLYTLDDMDGEPMYEVEVTPNADGTYHTIVAPKAEWVDAHKQLPVTIGATLAGIGTNVGYDFIMSMEQRIAALEAASQAEPQAE